MSRIGTARARRSELRRPGGRDGRRLRRQRLSAEQRDRRTRRQSHHAGRRRWLSIHREI